jgi:hypothetical protein
MAGFEVVAQQTPRAVTSSPPLFVILPPDKAVVWVISDTAAVVTVGAEGFLQYCIIAIRLADRNSMIIIFRKPFIVVFIRPENNSQNR